MTLARDAITSGGYCVVLALNVKNALESANRSRTKSAMRITGVLECFVSLVELYPSEWVLWQSADGSPSVYIIMPRGTKRCRTGPYGLACNA